MKNHETQQIANNAIVFVSQVINQQHCANANNSLQKTQHHPQAVFLIEDTTPCLLRDILH